MYLHVDILKRTHHLDIILEDLKEMAVIDKYEYTSGETQIKIAPFSQSMVFRLGVLLGQLPEVKDPVIANFKKHRKKGRR